MTLMFREIKNYFFVIPLFALLSALLCSASEARTFHVQLLSQPEEGHFRVNGHIVAANFDDPTPNFCYKKKGCYFAAFSNSKSWGENGSNGYGTQDKSLWEKRAEAAFSATTMGEVARNLRDKGVLNVEMSTQMRPDARYCVYAARNLDNFTASQYAGTLMSNCVDIPMVVAACTLTPDNILFDWGTLPSTEVSTVELTQSLTVACSQPTSIRLSINGEYIPLNGDNTTRAEFNLGNGWTGSTNVSVTNSEVIHMKSRLKGLSNRSGEFSGSAILLLEQL
ncbi:hypothetical protein NTH60_004710, partial [Enterobacter ludwigii]|nr:hypothetical protein [Enterobacter ludwigii]